MRQPAKQLELPLEHYGQLALYKKAMRSQTQKPKQHEKQHNSNKPKQSRHYLWIFCLFLALR